MVPHVKNVDRPCRREDQVGDVRCGSRGKTRARGLGAAMAAYCPCGCRSGPMTGATGRRVLLVDDEPDILTVARIVMTSHGGYAVRT